MGKEEIELYDYCNYNFDSLNYKLYLLKNNEFIIGKDIVFSKNYQEVKKVYDFNEIYKIIIKEL